VTRYLALLEALFLVHRLPAWSANLGKRLVKAAKLHVGDTGLASHLIGADAARLRQDPSLFGRMAESYVVGELRKQISWTDPQISLFHFRTAAGLEVDLLLEKPDGTVAGVEVWRDSATDWASASVSAFFSMRERKLCRSATVCGRCRWKRSGRPEKTMPAPSGDPARRLPFSESLPMQPDSPKSSGQFPPPYARR
jgi:inorganic triphosphatase YgiF